MPVIWGPERLVMNVEWCADTEGSCVCWGRRCSALALCSHSWCRHHACLDEDMLVASSAAIVGSLTLGSS